MNLPSPSAFAAPLALATFALSSPLAAAQGQPIGDGNSVYGLRLDASSQPAQAFSRVLGGRLSSGLDADMITLSDTALTFHFQPTRFSWSTSPSEADERDIAVMAGDSLDALYSAGNEGLREWSFDEPNGQYKVEVIDPDWADVTRLHAGASGILSGLDPVANLIRRYDPNAPSSFTDGSATPSLPAVRNSIDFVLMDWNNDTKVDRVFLTDTQIVVLYGLDGYEVIWELLLPSPVNQIEAVLGDESERDLLVWAGQVGPNWYLRTQHSEDVTGAIITLGPATAVDLHGANVSDGLESISDNAEELLLSIDPLRTWVFTRVPYEEPGGPVPYLLAPDIVTPYSTWYNHLPLVLEASAEGGGGGGNGYITGSADLDLDGDLEPLFARDIDGRVSFQLDGYHPEEHPIASFNAETVGSTASDPDKLRLSITNEGRAPSEATHVMAEFWRHSYENGVLSEDMDSARVARVFVQLAPTGTTTGGLPTYDSSEITLTGHADEDAYHVDVRAVRITDPSGAPVLTGQPAATDLLEQAWPTYTYYTYEPGQSATESTVQDWPGAEALSSHPEPPSGTTNPIKTGGGTDAGKGRGTGAGSGPPPIGGTSKSGEVGA